MDIKEAINETNKKYGEALSKLSKGEPDESESSNDDDKKGAE